MANGNATREFYNFSDQIRLQTTSLSSLSLGDNNIWSDTYLRKPEDRRNGAPDLPNTTSWFGGGQKLAFGTTTTFDRYNYNNNSNNSISTTTKPGSNYFNNGTNNYNSGGGEIKNYFNKAVGKQIGDTPRNKVNSNEGKGIGKKKNNSNNNNDNNGGSSAVDKRFKTLPPSEALPRSEAVGGYIFVCNNDTMQENLKRQLFGLPPRYRDSVRAITPGLPLFLYNYSTHQLHGIFEASSFGGTNIDPLAWEDKKCPGESRFPAQVRVLTRKICEPLEEDSFRPILHHYDGPKFRLELSVPEALALLDIFSENNV